MFLQTNKINKDEKQQLTLKLKTQMNYSSGRRNEQTVKDESNQEKLQNVNENNADDDDGEKTSSISFVNDLIASSDDNNKNKEEEIANSFTSTTITSTIIENNKSAENEFNLKLSDLSTISVINSNTNSKFEIKTSELFCSDNLISTKKINETSAARFIQKSTLGSESTTPYSSSHSTSSTGITVLENNSFKQNDLDQELSLLEDFDFGADEENDGDDEFDESLNVDEHSIDEDFDDGNLPAKLDAYDSLSEKTLSASTDAFKFEKLQGNLFCFFF